jgi:hypothetical protein
MGRDKRTNSKPPSLSSPTEQKTKFSLSTRKKKMWKSIDFQKGSIAKFHLLNRHGNPSILMIASLSLSCKPVEWVFGSMKVTFFWRNAFFHYDIEVHARTQSYTKQKKDKESQPVNNADGYLVTIN